jgi:hypothetical protein
LLRIAAPAAKIWSEDENTNPMLLEAGVVREKATASINDAEIEVPETHSLLARRARAGYWKPSLDPLSAIQDK